MTGTVLDVDTAVYYDTAAKVAAGAAAWWAAVDAQWPAMSQATNMAGSYSESKEWAKSYDTRATDILKMVTKVATAAHTYAIVLNEMGYQRALDEHGATVDAGPMPVKPAAPMYPVLNCRVPLPSAGGPGSGLIDGGLGLVEKIGITVPDGNATAISNAGSTWDAAKNAEGAAGFPAVLEAGALAFQDVIAPEAAFIDEDLRALKSAAEAALTAMGDLAQSCRDHRAALDELRDTLKQQLEMVRDALIQELAINAAIAVASSWITFGIGAAAGVAGAAAICARYARPMRILIERWHAARNLRAGVKLDQDLARHVRECERLEDLAPGGRLRPKADPPRPSLSAEDVAILRQGPSDSRANSLTAALREGAVTPDQQRQIDALNNALGKLPAHEGPLVRHTNLTDEQLSRYVEGKPNTELGFTSASTNMKGSNELLVNSSNVEFQIVSKTGRDFSQYGTRDEVLFASGTNFLVHSKVFDTAKNRWIIQMAEK
ncbi:ADP-ribosyltransferase [Nocardia gipuzkoensis]